MKESIRRVASIIGIFGLLAFSVVTLQQIAQSCVSGQDACFTAAVTFGVPQASAPVAEMSMTHSVVTSETAEDVPSMLGFIFTLI